MKIIDKIEELKYDTMQQLYRLIISSQEDKDNQESIDNKTSRKIEEINEEFIEKLEEFGFKASPTFIEYLSSEKKVTQSQINKYIQENSNELYQLISSLLGSYVQKIEYDEEIEDTREEQRIKSYLGCDNEEKDRKTRKQNMANLIEDYIAQIRSRIIAKLDVMDERGEELQSSINRELLWKKPEDFRNFLDEEDKDLYEQIENKIQEFFEQVSVIKAKAKEQESNPKTEFMQSINMRGLVDEQAAINKAAMQNQGNSQQELSIELYDE